MAAPPSLVGCWGRVAELWRACRGGGAKWGLGEGVGLVAGAADAIHVQAVGVLRCVALERARRRCSARETVLGAGAGKVGRGAVGNRELQALAVDVVAVAELGAKEDLDERPPDVVADDLLHRLAGWKPSMRMH